MAIERRDLILKSVPITEQDVRERIPFIETQADRDLAERPPWNQERINATIVSDFKSLIALDTQKYEASKTKDPIYGMVGSIIDELRESASIQQYLQESYAIAKTRAALTEEDLDLDGSDYKNRNNEINLRQRTNSRLLETVVNQNAKRALDAITLEQKRQYGRSCRDAEKERTVGYLLNGQFRAGDVLPLKLKTTAPMETAEIWGDLNTPLVSEPLVESADHVDILGAIFHAAVGRNGTSPPLTKGFINNRTYWLGTQPYMALKDSSIQDIKSSIASGRIAAHDLNNHIDSISNRMFHSLATAKEAFDRSEIDSALFLVLSVQRDDNGLKTGTHYECFQITRDPQNRDKFIIHEANSTWTTPVTKPATQIASIPNNSTLQYVLTQARKAKYDVSTLKATTVYHQATNLGCGPCAIQTAIDSATTGQNITELGSHNGSAQSQKGPYTLENELRISQMAILFNSPDPNVQRKLMTGSATPYIYLDGQTFEKQPAPNGTMLAEYLPPVMRASASQAPPRVSPTPKKTATSPSDSPSSMLSTSQRRIKAVDLEQQNPLKERLKEHYSTILTEVIIRQLENGMSKFLEPGCNKEWAIADATQSREHGNSALNQALVDYCYACLPPNAAQPLKDELTKELETYKATLAPHLATSERTVPDNRPKATTPKETSSHERSLPSVFKAKAKAKDKDKTLSSASPQAVNTSSQPHSSSLKSSSQSKISRNNLQPNVTSAQSKPTKTIFDCEGFARELLSENQDLINKFVFDALKTSKPKTIGADIAAIEETLNNAEHSVGLKIQFKKALSAISNVDPTPEHIKTCNDLFLNKLDIDNYRETFNKICSQLSSVELLNVEVTTFKEKGQKFFDRISGLPILDNEGYQQLVSDFKEVSDQFISNIEAKNAQIPYPYVSTLLIGIVGCIGMIGRALYSLYDSKNLSSYIDYKDFFFKSEKTRTIEKMQHVKTQLKTEKSDTEEAGLIDQIHESIQPKKH